MLKIKPNQKLFTISILISFLVLSTFVASLKADTFTTLPPMPNVSFDTGDSFAWQDVSHSTNLTFTVTNGVLNGTAGLNVTESGGVYLISPITSGVLSVTVDGTAYVAFNGLYGASTYTFVAGTPFVITWSYTQPAVNPIIVGNSNTTFYFRSDSYETNTETGYGLDNTNTATAQTVTSVNTGGGAATVYFGFRVWILHYGGSTTELTSGTPEAVLSRAVDGSGYQNATWTAPETSMMLGYDALKVAVYVKFGAAGAWTQRGVYLTHPLINSLIYAQTWTFNLYTTRTTTGDTTGAFSFGSPTYNSNINGVGFREPTNSEVSSWRINTQDYVGFVFGTYTDAIGASAYLLILAGFMGSLYWRNRSLGPVVFLFVIFGGSGGIIWAFVPEWAAIIVSAILLVGAAAIVFKVIR